MSRRLLNGIGLISEKLLVRGTQEEGESRTGKGVDTKQ